MTGLLFLRWEVLLPREQAPPTVAPAAGAPPIITLCAKYSRFSVDDSGSEMAVFFANMLLKPDASAEDIRHAYDHPGHRGAGLLRDELTRYAMRPQDRLEGLLILSRCFLYEGDFKEASAALAEARALVKDSRFRFLPWADQGYLRVAFLQGVTALRRGEVENCVECGCDSSCIFPLQPAAFHRKRSGSEEARRFLLDCLRRDPNDLGARWLLNIAAMTLGEYPNGVPQAYRIPLEPFASKEDVGRFKDIAVRVGVTRLNQSGGAIMDDFDNDGLLDVITSARDPFQSMAFYRNKGDGTFVDRTQGTGLDRAFDHLYCVQTDYNNDGLLDVFAVGGAWTSLPRRPTLLRNNGDGTFTDVTKAAGLEARVDTLTAAWADYDNDGHLDVFVGGETVRSRLYHNRGDGTFEEVALQAGVANEGFACKGSSWGDYDGDGLPDLLVSNFNGPPRLFHNNGDATFTDVATRLGLSRPTVGFSCWFFDYDNDGRLDLFVTGSTYSLDAVIRSHLGLPTEGVTPRLYRNNGDGTFADVTQELGLDKVMCPMGSNFVDVDNDGFLDIYLATGAPPYSMLVPNRMFRNVGGKRFVDVTTSSGTGHLQKGHAVACGDWDRDGNVDIYLEVGGAVPGDKGRNALFQNPGHPNNHWLTVKLIGKKTNRAAIGARIKATLPGGRTVYRHVTSGSSFGANALEQTIGLGPARVIESLEVYWPSSRTTQIFANVAMDQALAITEFDRDYRVCNRFKRSARQLSRMRFRPREIVSIAARPPVRSAGPASSWTEGTSFARIVS